MKVLAIETATSVCGAAVVENGKVVSERSLNIPHVHSEKIMTLIDEALHAANIGLHSIDGIAVSVGPGSFTGLRIGVSTAKGLAYASGVKVTAVSTLEALAWNIQNSKEVPVVPLVLSRRNEVYSAVYKFRGESCEQISPPQLVAISGLSQHLAEYPKALLIGNGAGQAYTALEEMIKRDREITWDLTPEEFRECRAGSVGIAGERQLIRGITIDASLLEPFYLQEAYATPAPQYMVQS